MKASEKLVVRAQVLKMGPDQMLLAFMIGWIAKHCLRLTTELQIVYLERAEDCLMANYEGILLGLNDSQFINSEVHERLYLNHIAKLLQGPFCDLAIGAGTEVRMELLKRYNELHQQAVILFAQYGDPVELDTSLFVEESAKFATWLMKVVEVRFRMIDASCWC